jgi:hypothetical protein
VVDKSADGSGAGNGGGAMSKAYLAINRCPNHGCFSISIDNETGGTRLTDNKCCGRWDIVKRFPMTEKQLRNIVIEIECASEQLESEE